MLSSIVITFVRHKVGLSKNKDAKRFRVSVLDDLKKFIYDRFKEYPNNYKLFENELNKFASEWEKKVIEYDIKSYKSNRFTKSKGLILKPSDDYDEEDKQWIVMQSMREIDTNSYIQINIP